MHFGATLRMLRVDAGITLRGLARHIGVSSAYLSRVENGHDPPPTTDRLVEIARVLGVAPTVLVDLANKVDPFVTRYLERVPAASLLFLEIARRDLGPADLARVKAFLDHELPRSAAIHEPWRRQRISDLLVPARVMLGVECEGLEDAIDLAAARLLSVGERVSAAEAAAGLRAREREGATLLGGGLAAPHCGDERVQPRASLLVLANPLTTPTPDGRPVHVVLAMFGGPRRGDLELLARVARLAHPALVDVLSRASDENAALESFSRMETSFG